MADTHDPYKAPKSDFKEPPKSTNYVMDGPQGLVGLPKNMRTKKTSSGRTYYYYDYGGNPCQGVRGYQEEGRDIYVFDMEYKITYDAGEQPLRDAMDLLYLTGQRPADVLKMDAKHIIEGSLEVHQNKRGQKLRIMIEGELAVLMDRLPKEGKLLRDVDGSPLSARRLRTLFDNARKKAGTYFQMRDLRAKAGTDKEDSQGMEAAKDQLGHKHQATTVKYVRNKREKKVSPTK